MVNNIARSTLGRRFVPLFIAVFFQGFVLWYAIEKLFMHHIGFNDAGIGVMVASYSAIMLLAETPSGILADRWSRKGVLMLASIALAVSSLLGGLSQEPMLYIVSALFWGVFFALYSGTYDSIVYDTVMEETGKSAQFEKYLGRVRMADSAALVAGSVVGGLVGQFFGLQMTFFITIALAVVPIIALAYFKEPQLHKAEPLGTIKEQLVQTFKAVLKRGPLLWLLALIVVLTLVTDMLYEFSQLWLVALQTPTAFYGPFFAAVIGTIGIGGYIAGRTGKHRRVVMVAALVAMALSSLVLATISNLVVVVVAQVMLGSAGATLSVLCLRDLHDSLPTNVRAGASSAVSTFARMLLAPTALLFGFISTQYNIFNAAWVLFALCLVLIPCYMQKYGTAGLWLKSAKAPSGS